MTDWQKMSENGETVVLGGDYDSYRTWVHTWARCTHCGKRGMDRAVFYGLQDIDGNDWWITETDCGCMLDKPLEQCEQSA